MKRFYIIFNLLLIILIVAAVFWKPEEQNISLNSLSRSLTTSVFGGMNLSPTVSNEENSVEDNVIERVVSHLEEDMFSVLPSAAILSDVLETQVGTMSAYGLDCSGCSGRVGAGFDAAAHDVQYYDSQYGLLRIVAGDKKYPYGTVVRVKNSTIGSFQAIVLDRGGDIGIGRRYLFDLLFHTESEASQFGLSKDTIFEVLRYGY